MHGLHVCATCSLEDSNAAKLMVHRCPQTSQLVLECPGPLRDAGPGWKLVQVEPDGNCLFATLMLGKFLVLDRAPVPSDPVKLKNWTAKAATSCRDQYLEHVREKHHEFKIGGLALQHRKFNCDEYKRVFDTHEETEWQVVVGWLLGSRRHCQEVERPGGDVPI